MHRRAPPATRAARSSAPARSACPPAPCASPPRPARTDRHSPRCVRSPRATAARTWPGVGHPRTPPPGSPRGRSRSACPVRRSSASSPTRRLLARRLLAARGRLLRRLLAARGRLLRRLLAARGRLLRRLLLAQQLAARRVDQLLGDHHNHLGISKCGPSIFAAFGGFADRQRRT